MWLERTTIIASALKFILQEKKLVPKHCIDVVQGMEIMLTKMIS